jgi:hypothetical protein
MQYHIEYYNISENLRVIQNTLYGSCFIEICNIYVI